MARRKGRAYERARKAEQKAREAASRVSDYAEPHAPKTHAKAPGTRFWTAERRAAMSRAVSQFNSTITRLAKQYKGVVELPNYVNLADEFRRVGNARQFKKRVGQLNRILKKNKSDAHDIIETSPGRYMLKYLKRELQYAQRENNRVARQLRYELYPKWDEMSPLERATASVSSNINPDTRDAGEMGGDDLEDMWRAEWDKAWDYFQRYLEVWEQYHGEYEGYSEVVRIINDFYAYAPDGLVTILEGPDPEKDINYIYPTGRELKAMGYEFRKNRRGRSVPKRGSVSSDMTPMESKRRNVLKFWQRKAAEYGI